MAVQIEPAAKPSLIKREPVVVGGAILALIQAFIVNAPDLGIRLPSATQTIFGVIVTIAGAFGIKTATRPVALSVPATPAEAKAQAKVPSVSKLEGAVGTVAKVVAAVTKPNPIKAAATKAKSVLKGKG